MFYFFIQTAIVELAALGTPAFGNARVQAQSESYGIST